MTSHSDYLSPKVFEFPDTLTEIRNTENLIRLLEIFRDRPITRGDLERLSQERNTLYRITKEIAKEVDRFYDASRKLAAENAEMKKELDALKKSIDWNP